MSFIQGNHAKSGPNFESKQGQKLKKSRISTQKAPKMEQFNWKMGAFCLGGCFQSNNPK